MINFGVVMFLAGFLVYYIVQCLVNFLHTFCGEGMPFFAKEAKPSGGTGPADTAASLTPSIRQWTG